MIDLSRIQSALAYIPPHDRDVWVNTGMALHSELGPDGFTVWDDWAAGADSHNERDARAVWRSFTPGKITVASLYHEAKAHGWTPEKPLAPLSATELAEREQLRIQRQQRAEAEEAERQADNERKAVVARRLGDEAMPLMDHPYIERKGVKTFGAAKVQQAGYLKGDDGKPLTNLSGLCMLLPIKRDGQIVALQVIQPDGERRFIGSPKGGALTLGNLKDAQRILICEGFATAASLHESTTMPVVCAFSAGNMLDVVQRLHKACPAAELVLCADQDTHGKGQQKATEAAQAVGGLIALPDFSNAPESEAKAKATDYNDLHQLLGREEVARQVAAAKPVEIAERSQPDCVDRVEIIRAADITPEPIRWLWDGWLARGKLAIMAGAPGTGKTTLAMAFAAAVTTGGYWPDGSRTPRGNVLIWSGEDDPKDTLVPRLHAAGADVNRVFFVGETVPAGADSRSFDPARDLAALTRAIAGAGEIRLMIVDPIVSAVAGDSHKNAEVRRSLQPLVELANKLDCALVGISHFSKGTQGRDPHERVTGSIAFSALARVVLATAKAQGDDGEAGQILVRAKSNIGPDTGGFRYEFEQAELASVPGVFASRVMWGEAVEGEARELLAAQSDDDGEGGTLADAKQFLADLLEFGPAPAKTIKADADGAGYSWATIRRAGKALGVKSTKGGMKDGWRWELPRRCSINSEDAQQKSVNTFGNFEHLRKESEQTEGEADEEFF